ncbi:hypothetical protein BOTBODRAFT_26078 [Botryobasidium botryosum FD-172 SS1]|uniref:Autophagy-related protein 14 n=1 Tax=Botryobasidium botryosum (strain FD-172 SS1) TaxID=930990 RepID=A0A067N1A5_BOTB1|nr:hypothetical protein BOTBODRAFT_26078 [Botryobasidium botryosum FD-172 SS1]
MQCPTCNLHQRKFYCTSCICNHVRDFRISTHKAEAERDAEVAKAKVALGPMEKRRIARAEAASLEERIVQVREQVGKTKSACDAARARIRSLRQTLVNRRANLDVLSQSSSTSSSQSLVSPSPFTRDPPPIQVSAALVQTHADLAQTRRVLIRELLNVFDIQQRAPRPSLVSSTIPFLASSVRRFGLGASMLLAAPAPAPPPAPVHPNQIQWTIAGLVFPVPGDIHRFPTDHVQAVVQHTLHFMSLLSFYLGVKLPFEVFWDGNGSVGVGKAWIRAGRGPEQGGWARWSEAQPLHPVELPSSNSPSSSRPSSPSRRSSSGSNTQPSPSRNSASSPFAAMATGLAMLNYNVAYLLYTQGLDIPLSATGETLRNLYALCSSPRENTGRLSHATPNPLSPLPPPTPSSFTLEFGHLLQIQNASAPSAPSSSRRSRRGLEEDWDIVEVEEEV